MYLKQDVSWHDSWIAVISPHPTSKWGGRPNRVGRPESRNRRASRLPHPACHRGNARHLTHKNHFQLCCGFSAPRLRGLPNPTTTNFSETYNCKYIFIIVKCLCELSFENCYLSVT